MSFYSELKRRNVFKVAIVYSAVAWLLLQISDTLGPALHLPEWFLSAVAFLLILGFPVSIVFAWAFELTPEGLKRETETDPSASRAGKTSKKFNRTIFAALVLALGYFVFDKFVLDPGRDAAGIATAVQDAQQQTAESGTGDNSIAVLPFVNMSSDEEQEYFSDGLSEELLNLLAKIPELQVAARTSSFSFKGQNLEIPEIASRLKVAHVLEGSVRKYGNQLRITAQLIQADNGYHIWSETYDRQLDNIFQIQEEIAIAVVDALQITMLGEAPKTRKTDPAAYQLFLEGQYLKRHFNDWDLLLKAVELFKQAVEIDPDYAPAWAEMADTYMWMGGGSREFSGEDGATLIDDAIENAIRIDPDYAFTYYVRGVAWFFNKHNFNKGVEDFQYALELEPDNAFLVAAIGKGAVLTGNFDDAISQYQAALILEPLVPEFYWFLGKAYRSAGRLDDAEASFRTMANLSGSTRGNIDLWETLFLKGEFEAALAESDNLFTRTVTHYASGNVAKADENLAELIEVNADRYPYSITKAYAYRGDADKTFEWLNYSLENNGDYPTFILSETAFHSVYSDPRWELFMEKLGLLEFWLEMQSASGL